MPTNKKIAIAAIIISSISLIILFTPKAKYNENKIETSSLIEYPSQYNFRQTFNDCGPFNVAAVVRAVKQETISSDEFAKNITWRLPNKYTLPWGIENQLKASGLKIEKPNLRQMSDEEKISFLQERLSQKKPIIILGQKDKFEHYITIFGFNKTQDEFYIYDSIHKENPNLDGLTKDDNEELPGNKTISSKDLLNFWGNGGMFGIYKWYAVVVSLK